MTAAFAEPVLVLACVLQRGTLSAHGHIRLSIKRPRLEHFGARSRLRIDAIQSSLLEFPLGSDFDFGLI